MKTKTVLLSILGLATVMATTGCTSQADGNYPPQPSEDAGCDDWDWNDELKVWECDEYDGGSGGSGSSGGRVYYHNGKLYKSKQSLITSSDYDSYKKSSSFTSYGPSKSSSMHSSGSSGVGGKSSFFGG